jgi:hypothetical protein
MRPRFVMWVCVPFAVTLFAASLVRLYVAYVQVEPDPSYWWYPTALLAMLVAYAFLWLHAELQRETAEAATVEAARFYQSVPQLLEQHRAAYFYALRNGSEDCRAIKLRYANRGFEFVIEAGSVQAVSTGMRFQIIHESAPELLDEVGSVVVYIVQPEISQAFVVDEPINETLRELGRGLVYGRSIDLQGFTARFALPEALVH